MFLKANTNVLNSNKVPWKHAKNTMDGICKQRGSFKENGNEKYTCT